MEQCVKNPTAVAWVTEEVQLQFLALCSGLKEPALLQLRFRSQLQLRFSLWPRNIHMPRLQPQTNNQTNKIKIHARNP